ncbi:MAG: DUF4040 domain-containing protein [Candidatus Omnitrophica bacterium]|nr:DUF4040 domain-containing protein [Candidatus Omnitrophota bacterium]
MILLLFFLPFFGAGLLACHANRTSIFHARAGQAVLALSLALLAYLTWVWDGSNPIVFEARWAPQLGLSLSLYLDGPALFYCWLILSIALLVFQYSEHYMRKDDSPRRFFATLLAFVGSMLGLVVSGNLILMFVFWELTSLTSFLLIGHWSDKAEAVKGAQRAILVTGLGGLSLMAGIAVLANIGSELGVESFLEWDTLWRESPRILNHPDAPIVLVLMLIGAFTKSAQFPFHFWLPGAMQAPTPVSALLHSATMVKAGVYLIGRLYPIFNESLLWLVLVGGIGAVTMLVGAALAISSRDLKQLLAYSTVSQLGLLVAYYGFGYQGLAGDLLLRLDLLLIASHALFKCSLFMLCGVIDHETGTRDRTRLGGLWRKMPVTAALSILACLSMVGAPFTLGFVAKKLFLEAAYHLNSPLFYLEEALFALAIFASAFTVCYSMQFAGLTFLGKPRDGEIHRRAHEGPPGMLFAPTLLILLCVAGGLYVPLIEEPLGLLVQSEVIESEVPYSIAFFKHIDLLFWFSLALFFVGGPLLFLLTPTLTKWRDRLTRGGSLTATWDWLLQDGIQGLASNVSEFFQSPSRVKNTGVVLGLLALGIGYAFLERPWNLSWAWSGSPMEWLAVAMAPMVLVLTLMVVAARNALQRVLALGFIGLIVGGWFVLYKAADLAITQVLVELVLILMFLKLIATLRKSGEVRERRPLSLHALALSLCVGISVGLLSYTSATSEIRDRPIPPDRTTPSAFYLENAKYPSTEGEHSGGGYNVVNVILVDFRAMDTFGEIVVLVVAALGVVILVRSGTSRKNSSYQPHSSYGPTKTPVDWVPPLLTGGPSTFHRVAPIVSILTLAFAGVLFFVGHNQPGGGFIAGLTGCIAAVPLVLMGGAKLSGESMLDNLQRIMAVGLIVALSTGLMAIPYGFPFLRSAHGYYTLPFVGEIELASAMLFDFGVFLTVLGVASTILHAYARDTEG